MAMGVLAVGLLYLYASSEQGVGDDEIIPYWEREGAVVAAAVVAAAGPWGPINSEVWESAGGLPDPAADVDKPLVPWDSGSPGHRGVP